MPVTFSLESDATPWPSAVSELDGAERMVARWLRQWSAGLRENAAGRWALVWTAFTREFGAEDGKAALSGLAAMMMELQGGARRRIRVHPPCCPYLGADEIRLIGFVAVCQRQEWPRARALAEEMVRPDGVGVMLEAGARLARVLRRHDLWLPPRCTAYPTIYAGKESGARVASGRPSPAHTIH